MGQADTTTARYLRRNEIFADMFNFFLYNGEEVIDPDSLRELDTREIEVPYGGTGGKGSSGKSESRKCFAEHQRFNEDDGLDCGTGDGQHGAS